ncbi:uncharacterized protein TNIN_378391 [Trichonephila inaurata madagascariensis]|uniref:Uncharacterized protein n=1 Tax=Trichonephila inaurata madagascariensis TaxID=2747483 RepID=A0A8X7CIX1_9ARAC|nr:uncharacterized protein TNIN_378391 [Trichonephila inaurata madagascariensis]
MEYVMGSFFTKDELPQYCYTLYSLWEIQTRKGADSKGDQVLMRFHFYLNASRRGGPNLTPGEWVPAFNTPTTPSLQIAIHSPYFLPSPYNDGKKYRDRFTELCAKIDHLATKETSEIVTSQRKFKLPKIELKKFSGDAKEYMTFWTQFRKIDEDSSIPPEDKFQYLLQAVVPKSKAARVAESFPATADKYPKATAQLKDGFGREDL